MTQIHHHYTESEKDFLRAEIENADSYKKLAEMFNEHFGTVVSASSLSDLCIKRLGIKIGRNIGRFTDAHRGRENAPLGTERIYNGYLFVKVDDIHAGNPNEDFRHNWIPKQRFVYERNVRPLKDDEIVIFIDGNKDNFSPDNLYAISRKVHARMCGGSHYKSDPLLTKIALLSCEILQECNDERNKEDNGK